MPITLNHSNINVQYSTGSNYIIETVKSDLYIRDSRTGISSNLTGEPKVIFPTTFTKVQSFIHSGGGEAQTSYTFNFPVDTLCDILIVGGGGGGSHNHGGGGGAGAVVFIKSVILNSGSYTIQVGAGGAKGTRSTTNFGGLKGNDSKIILNNVDILRAEGGGGGGQGSAVGSIGNGGSGGGGDGYRDASTPVYNNGIVGTGSIKDYNGTTGVLYGNNGGTHYLTTSGSYLNKAGAGGGGGGAEQVGSNATKINVAGNGGNGISSATINGFTYNFVDMFGTTYGTNNDNNNTTRYFGGGGGGSLWGDATTVHAPATDIGANPINGSGGKGGGGAGALTAQTTGSNGTANTGGGGGGGSFGNNDHTVDGGNGGSGIVIIKYRNVPEQNENEKQITLTYNLNNSIVYESIVYDFSQYKDLTSWKNYATSIGARNNFTHGFFHIYDGVFVSDRFIGFFELTLPSSYNTITVSFTNGHSDYKDDKDNLVNLKINGDIKATAKSSETITYTQIYSAGDILRIEEIWSFIRNLKITLENRKLYYKATFPISTDVTINGNKAKFDAGTYDIIMGPSSSEIRNRASKILFGNYENRYGYKLEFKYPITKTLQQLHDDSTSFSGTIYTIGMSDQKYSLGNKTSGTIKKYKVYIYKRLLNHNIELYANNTLLNKGTDYITGNDEDAVPKTINLRNLYITINKNIAGIIYLKSDKPIFFISETNRTSFNNTTDTQFGTNVNNLKASGSGTLSSLNDIFRVSEANTALTTAQNRKITYNINTILESPLTISYNSSTINTTNPSGKNSLDNLMTTYNNIHRYNESSGGALTEKINEYTFGNILNPTETDIEKYISYEYPTAPTDDKLTPSSRNTAFDIRSNATKYIYFRKSS